MSKDLLKALALLDGLTEDSEGEEINIEDNIQGDSEEKGESKSKDLSILSIDDARRLLALKGGFGKAKFTRKITEAIINPNNNISAEVGCDDVINLVSDYSSLGDQYSALKICDHFLKIFPYNADLLSYGVLCATHSGQFDKGQKYIDALNEMKIENWTWRAFLYTAIYYKEKATNCSSSEIANFRKKGIEVCHNYQKILPFDERGYNQEAEILLDSNKINEAIDILKNVIFNSIVINGENVKIKAPQCCATLLSIIKNGTDYDLIIKTSMKGILYTTQDQPSVKIGYFTYLIALAKDALITENEYNNKAEIQDALSYYQCAYDLNRDRSYAKTIEIRYAILSQNPKNPITDKPLLKRELVCDVDDLSDNGE